MRSSSIQSDPVKKKDGYIFGPRIYEDNTGDNVTSRSRVNQSFTDHSPTLDMGSLSFQSSNTSSSRDTKKSKKSKVKKRKEKEVSKVSKKERKIEFNDEQCLREDKDERRDKSTKEKIKRAQIIELAKRAEKEHDKLLLRRAKAQETTKEIDSSMKIEEDTRHRSIDMMKNKLEGMDWRSNRYLTDVKKEIGEWKEMTATSGDLAKRVETIEERMDRLEKTNIERKKSMDVVEKNWIDFNRLRSQSMAMEITQIKNRRGNMYLSMMPEEVAKTTAKNLYKLCSDLNRLTYHLNHKSDFTRLVDEALILAEAIAPLYGPKDEFTDSRETTSSTNVSLVSTGDKSSSSGVSSAPASPNSKESLTGPIRANLTRAGLDPTQIHIPPQSKFDPKYSVTENRYIDAPSLREKVSNYYSDSEFSAFMIESQAFSKEAVATGESSTRVSSTHPQPTIESSTISAPIVPVSAVSDKPVPSTTNETSSASISLSIDSDKDALMKQLEESKEKSRSQKSQKESKPTVEETKM